MESGKLTVDSLTTMLLRKADWHDYEGIKYLLEHGADPNRMTHWGFTALHQGLRRDNALEEHRRDVRPRRRPETADSRDGLSALAIAARRGRGDVLDSCQRRDIPIELQGVERLIAACARNDAAGIHVDRSGRAGTAPGVDREGGTLLAQFAGTGALTASAISRPGRRRRNGVQMGDPYFDIAKESTALHVAAWRARHDTVRFLIERGRGQRL